MQRKPYGAIAEALRVAKEYIDPNFDWSLAFQRNKKHAVAHSRFVLWTLMRRGGGISLPIIGRDFGLCCDLSQAKFDHTSVLYGIRQVDKGEICLDFDLGAIDFAASRMCVAVRDQRSGIIIKHAPARLEMAA